MRIKNITFHKFKRFENLKIQELPDCRLIVVCGPNGCGKSSLFDGFYAWQQAQDQLGLNWDNSYYSRGGETLRWNRSLSIELDQPLPTETTELRKMFCLRSAYRNDPDFTISSLARLGKSTDERRFHKMIDSDSAVSSNYQRLVSSAFADVFVNEDGATTVAEFRENVLGEIRDVIRRLFPDLTLNSLGDPLADGTFRFDKGSASGFAYKNLSGGEKAAFDLMLDVLVKRREYDNTIFCIDEPEAHMNTRLQGALLQELYDAVPDNSQLWIASHSIGMMRKARELYEANQNDVVFLDFGGHEFDTEVIITPSIPNRIFWEKVLDVALDDLAALVAPREVVICEGNPLGPAPSKNAEHDAKCLETIFATEYPDVKFLSAGSSKEITGDRLNLLSMLQKLVSGTTVKRLIDRDDHALEDVASFKNKGVTVLTRRHLESFLYDDEILSALCDSKGQSSVKEDLINDRKTAMASSHERGNPIDDVKSAAPRIYLAAKTRLSLTAVGDDQMAFARNVLSGLVTPETAVYKELKRTIFP